jgi:hypothetical protein
MKRKQLVVFLVMLVVYALSAFATYTFFIDELVAVAGVTMPEMELPPVVFGLANAGIVLVVYGLLGFGGYWFAKKLGLPGIFREDGTWHCMWHCPHPGRHLICTLQRIWQVSASWFPSLHICVLKRGDWGRDCLSRFRFWIMGAYSQLVA